MIDNETVRKASEIGIIDVVDAIKLIETNPAYITLTFDEKINIDARIKTGLVKWKN